MLAFVFSISKLTRGYRSRWLSVGLVYISGKELSIGLSSGRPGKVITNLRTTFAPCMGFVWEHADSFLHCVASPFHSFVTTCFASCVLAGRHAGAGAEAAQRAGGAQVFPAASALLLNTATGCWWRTPLPPRRASTER